MRTHCGLICGLSVATVVACGSEPAASTRTSCPHYFVQVDAGATGFTSVGEYQQDSAFCAQYCAADYPVCQLAEETKVKCQRGCA